MRLEADAREAQISEIRASDNILNGYFLPDAVVIRMQP